MKTLLRISLVILLILQGQFLFGQNWSKVYNIQSFMRTGQQGIEVDGGFIVISFTAGKLIKVDYNGNYLWSMGTNCSNLVVTSTSDGGFAYIAACGDSIWDVQGMNTVYDTHLRIVKLDANGDEQWSDNYREIDSIPTLPWFIEQSALGNYYITGYSSDNVGATESRFIIKKDSLGSTLWDKHYPLETIKTLGLANQDEMAFIITTPTGHRLVYQNQQGDTTWASGRITINPQYLFQSTSGYYYGYSTNLLMKIDSSGNELWKTSSDLTSLIELDANYLLGTFIKTESYIVNPGDTILVRRAGVKKFDSSGNLLWTRLLHDSLPDISSSTAYDITLTNNNNLLITGTYGQSIVSVDGAFVVHIDSSFQNLPPVGWENVEIGSEWLSINNVRTIFNADNSFFWDLADAHYHVPKDSPTSSIFAGALWIGGYDAGGNLHVAAQTYKQTGTDFWPGPLDSNGSTDLQTADHWNKVWKVTKKQIDQHIADYQDNNIIDHPQAAIYEWPGAGNSYARGRDGIPLSPNLNAAPFYDRTGNAGYEPDLGEFPEINGDEMLWFVFNDAHGQHTETGGKELKIEAHISAYGYNCSDDSILNNTIFINYKIANKSGIAYDSVYIGKWVDFDLGCFNNDYIGCDTISNTFYTYNGTPIDADCASHGYGNSPPIQTVTFLDHKMNSFLYYNNDFSVNGNPTVDTKYYNYLEGIWYDNTPVNTSYMFPGNPSDSTQWSECSDGNDPADRRGIGSIGPFTFQAGQVFDMTLAFSTHFLPYQACPDFTPYRARIDSIIHKFNNGLLAGCDTSIITCADTSLGCVWPGDANNDGVADIFDVLPIGIAYDSAGPIRPNANTSWTGQPMQDWPQGFMVVGENFKHADCDGSGMIDSFDFQPILDNYGLIHLKKGGSRVSGIPLSFDFPPGNYTAGSRISVPILLGTDSIRVAGFYGIALRMNYNTSVVQPGSVTVDFDSSWVGTQHVDMKGLYKELSGAGRVDIGLTKIDHTNSIGYGKIAVVNFILIDDIAGKGAMKLTEMLGLNISEAKAISNDESEIELNIINSIEEHDFINQLLIYPNPTTGQLNIDMAGKEVNDLQINIYNTLGQNIYHLKRKSVDQFSESISLNKQATGIYLVKITFGNAVITRKVVVK